MRVAITPRHRPFFLLLVATTAWAMGPVGAQVGTDVDPKPVGSPTAGVGDTVGRIGWGICAFGALLHDIPTPWACPTPGSTTRIWNVECNPLCYTTTHQHDHTTRGHCLDLVEEIRLF